MASIRVTARTKQHTPPAAAPLPCAQRRSDRPLRSAGAFAASLLALACGGQQPGSFAPPPVTTAAPVAPVAVTPIAGAPASSPPLAATAPQMPVAANVEGSAGSAGGVPSSAAGAAAAASNATPPHTHDECMEPTKAAPEDAMTSSTPEVWTSPNGSVDLLLPKPVQSWMDARLFKEGHDGWHGIRRCNLIRTTGSGGGGGPGLMFSSAYQLCQMTALKPAEQECEGTTDGYQFLATHRHMIEVLRQAFPAHKDLFAGFPKFPFNAQDVPEQWRSRFGNGWSQQILDAANTLEDIEHQLARFPTEGDLGQFIQCGRMAMGVTAVHGAMHGKWVVNRSPVMLGDTATNLGNYMFWKLHGWIDDIWTRYRKAKGLRDDDPTYVAALADQCREMHKLGMILGPNDPSRTPMQPLPMESGMFHEQVRPILETNCAGCHSGGSPEGGMVLGGNVSSAAIVHNLVNVQASRGGQFKRVLPGNAAQSWIYLKASGKAASAGCTGMCNAEVMPPTGMVTLSADELSTIERWIMSGAPAPTSP